jgi:eukaryotic-like serine/threonine-protein kinase
MREYIRCCGVEDPLAARLYLLDISQGPHQQVNNLRRFTRLNGGSFEGITLGHDRSKLFLSHCSCGFPAGTGPSSITEQLPTGERARTIYTNITSAITSMVILNQSALLVLVESYDNADAIVNVDTSHNGLWRINTDGSGWTRLTTDSSNQQTTLNTATQYPWANISRDGITYAAQKTTIVSESIATYSTLYLGSVQGGTTKSIYNGSITSTTDNPQSTLSVVGWTTM